MLSKYKFKKNEECEASLIPYLSENDTEFISFLPASAPDFLASFKIAHQFIDYIGEVDVISDAHNVKKLLKMPYSSSDVSLIVHKIKNTLLLEDFDLVDDIKNDLNDNYNIKQNSKIYVYKMFKEFLKQQLPKECGFNQDFDKNGQERQNILEDTINYETLLIKCLYLRRNHMTPRIRGGDDQVTADKKDLDLWDNNNLINNFIRKVYSLDISQIHHINKILSLNHNAKLPALLNSHTEMKSLTYKPPLSILWPFDNLTSTMEDACGNLSSSEPIDQLHCGTSILHSKLLDPLPQGGAVAQPSTTDAGPMTEDDEILTELILDMFGSGDDGNESLTPIPGIHPSSRDSVEGYGMEGSGYDAYYVNTDYTRSVNQNYLWKFEDLRMLVRSDLPIFGGGKYPAVSLRLRDLNKPPINILTGLDYWLDNLMCNVPELVMCYHLDGIVKRYEMLKTDQIPDHAFPGSEDPNGNRMGKSFDPRIVRDLAQNILSFIRSNCTTEGHTYWLFKGRHDEVVKLYDLSSIIDGRNSLADTFPIPGRSRDTGRTKGRHRPRSQIAPEGNEKCGQQSGDDSILKGETDGSVDTIPVAHLSLKPSDESVRRTNANDHTYDLENPYTLPVAFLLYRVALNMKLSSATKKKRATTNAPPDPDDLEIYGPTRNATPGIDGNRNKNRHYVQNKRSNKEAKVEVGDREDFSDDDSDGTLILLLQKCLELLLADGGSKMLCANKTKDPQVARLYVSASYALADIYVPSLQDPFTTDLNQDSLSNQEDGSREKDSSSDNSVFGEAKVGIGTVIRGSRTGVGIEASRRKRTIPSPISLMAPKASMVLANLLVPSPSSTSKSRSKKAKKKNRKIKEESLPSSKHCAPDSSLAPPAYGASGDQRHGRCSDGSAFHSSSDRQKHFISIRQVHNAHEKCRAALKCVVEAMSCLSARDASPNDPTKCDLTWIVASKALLLEKSFTIYGILINLAMACQKFGRASKYLKLCLICYESLRISLETLPQLVLPIEPEQMFLTLLELGGDFHVRIIAAHMLDLSGDTSSDESARGPKETYDAMLEDSSYVSGRDGHVIGTADYLSRYAVDYLRRRDGSSETADTSGTDPHKLAWIHQLSPRPEKHLVAAGLCYQKAIKLAANLEQVDVRVRMGKKLGNLKNEVANHYFSKALNLYEAMVGQGVDLEDSRTISDDTSTKTNDLMEWCAKSYDAYGLAIKSFGDIGDDPNVSLLSCNQARVPLLRAKVLACSSPGGESSPFGLGEKLCYREALEILKRAHDRLHSMGTKQYQGKDNYAHVKVGLSSSDTCHHHSGSTFGQQLLRQVCWQMSDINYLVARYFRERGGGEPTSQGSEEVLGHLKCARKYLDEYLSLLPSVEKLAPPTSCLQRISCLDYDTGSVYFRRAILASTTPINPHPSEHPPQIKEDPAKLSLSLANAYFDKALTSYRHTIGDIKSALRVEIQRLSYYKLLAFDHHPSDGHAASDCGPDDLSPSPSHSILKSGKHLESIETILSSSIHPMLLSTLTRSGGKDDDQTHLLSEHEEEGETLKRLLEVMVPVFLAHIQISTSKMCKKKNQANYTKKVARSLLAGEDNLRICRTLLDKLNVVDSHGGTYANSTSNILADVVGLIEAIESL